MLIANIALAILFQKSPPSPSIAVTTSTPIDAAIPMHPLPSLIKSIHHPHPLPSPPPRHQFRGIAYSIIALCCCCHLGICL
uniref:Uncharacterized protein n=1 Tax=Oryza sativa subsp. japonica TaxID=39947 RepID=Q6YYQ8_ORYSJ|nr:hypothetical protein [Oryza sativa Japonica Group]BAD03804.1 hypothetical protein [Oryza sativa Japonica Group]